MSPDRLPQPGTVVIRRFTLTVEVQELERLKSFLDQEELKRGARLVNRTLGDRYLAGRGYLREVLGRCLLREPAQIRLGIGSFGKPNVVGEPGESDVRFNVAHSADRMLVALTVGKEVGIDLEEVREELEFAPMAKRYFSPRERGELFALPLEEQRAAFYRCWTRKEAYLKGLGQGFHQSTHEFDVTLLPDAAPELIEHRGHPEHPRRWRIVDIAVPDGYLAALAYEGNAPKIQGPD